MIKLASKALNSTPLVFFTTFTTLFVTWWNWWLYLIKNLPNSRTLKDHPIEIQIKDELQLSIFSVVPPPTTNIFSFWPLQRIRLDEYLSFRIIDRRRKEAEWHFTEFSQRILIRISKFFANVAFRHSIFFTHRLCRSLLKYYYCQQWDSCFLFVIFKVF